MKQLKKIFFAILLLAILPSYTIAGEQFLNAAFNKCSKIRLTCVDAEKTEINSNKTLNSFHKDVLIIRIYDNFKSVKIESENFGFNIEFEGKFEFQEKTERSKDSKGKLYDFSKELYIHEDNEGLTYIRTKDKSLVTPLLQVFHNGYIYGFNIAYAEIYDSDNNKWVYGQTNATDASGDKLRSFFRDKIGIKFCSNFEGTLEDRLAVHGSDDPWNK